jgi:2-alkenal reductase
MANWFNRLAVIVLLLLAAALVAEPYIDRIVFAAREPRPVSARGDLAELERSTIELFASVAPSVVQVIAVPQGSGIRIEAGMTAASGSGFVWDDAGHVVTNHHVVAKAASVAIRLASGQVVRARTIGLAPTYDIAVLMVAERAALPPPVPVGSSKDLQVGQSAFAIGNPFGLDQSLTTGVISALQRRLPTSGGREVADVIQTDAAINPGNSGGPLLDSAGRLIGVNTAIFSPSGANAGVGFAVPIDVVNTIVPQLIRDGRVPIPGIGILAADEAVSARLGIEGVLVADVVPGSPAERAGIRGFDLARGEIGDVVAEVDGQPVRHLSELAEQLERAGIGEQVEITVRRRGGAVSMPRRGRRRRPVLTPRRRRTDGGRRRAGSSVLCLLSSV